MTYHRIVSKYQLSNVLLVLTTPPNKKENMMDRTGGKEHADYITQDPLPSLPERGVPTEERTP